MLMYAQFKSIFAVSIMLPMFYISVILCNCCVYVDGKTCVCLSIPSHVRA